jgi:hypothetical protein
MRLVGPSRPNAARRSTHRPTWAPRSKVLEGWTHVDPILSEQPEPTASILRFVEANRAGTVSLGGVGK